MREHLGKAGIATGRLPHVAGLVSCLSVALAWLCVLIEPGQSDGAAEIFMLFGAPSLCSAVLFIFFVGDAMAEREEPADRRWLWWPLGIMPVGVLAALVFNIVRYPDYWDVAGSPLMLVWLPIFIAAAILAGPLVAGLFLGPVVVLVRVVIAVIRGKLPVLAVLFPLVWLSFGVGLLIAVGSVNRIDGFGRVNLFAAFFGLPGDYVVVWQPGLWIVRAMVTIVLLLFGWFLWYGKRIDAKTGRVQPGASPTAAAGDPAPGQLDPGNMSSAH